MSVLDAYWSEMRNQLMVAPTAEDLAIKLQLVGRADESFAEPKDYAPYVSAGMATGDRADADIMHAFEESNENMSNGLRPRYARQYLRARRAFVGLPDDMRAATRVYSSTYRIVHAQLSGKG
jgi:hypothetical protein